jgi:hypothetical protein
MTKEKNKLTNAVKWRNISSRSGVSMKIPTSKSIGKKSGIKVL